jgi:hypothetical protein
MILHSIRPFPPIMTNSEYPLHDMESADAKYSVPIYGSMALYDNDGTCASLCKLKPHQLMHRCTSMTHTTHNGSCTISILLMPLTHMTERAPNESSIKLSAGFLVTDGDCGRSTTIVISTHSLLDNVNEPREKI